MTIGKKFLERVLSEAREKDVDGFKDNFDITSISASSPAIANLPMPMARQVVQLYHLLGVSVETLESRPKAVKEAAMEMADQFRTNRPLRVAAQRLFAALATAKGFARIEKVTEALDDVMNANLGAGKDVRLMGTRVVKQIEALLGAMKMPSGLLQRAMRRDAQALMDTALLLQRGALRTKFQMLAQELGVDLNAVEQSIKVEEAFDTSGPELGQARAAQAMETLVTALGLDGVFNSREAMSVRRALPQKFAALKNPTAVYTLIDRLVKELNNTK